MAYQDLLSQIQNCSSCNARLLFYIDYDDIKCTLGLGLYVVSSEMFSSFASFLDETQLDSFQIRGSGLGIILDSIRVPDVSVNQ